MWVMIVWGLSGSSPHSLLIEKANTMEVKFEASKAELIELSKMAYIAQYVVDSSGRFSTGYHYLY